jgi:hypothetical protein
MKKPLKKMLATAAHSAVRHSRRNTVAARSVHGTPGFLDG